MMPARAVKPDRTFINPFTVAIDSREQIPYVFQGLRTNIKEGNKLIVVATRRVTLPTGRGDYSILELPSVAIERKSKCDLYQSANPRPDKAKNGRRSRDNFVRRLELMQSDPALVSAHIVVEAEPSEILTDPPRHTTYNPKSLWRTIIAWQIRYPRVHWHFMPDRATAEAHTFRLLERCWAEFGPEHVFQNTES